MSHLHELVFAPLQERRASLQLAYGYKCNCARCKVWGASVERCGHVWTGVNRCGRWGVGTSGGVPLQVGHYFLTGMGIPAHNPHAPHPPHLPTPALQLEEAQPAEVQQQLQSMWEKLGTGSEAGMSFQARARTAVNAKDRTVVKEVVGELQGWIQQLEGTMEKCGVAPEVGAANASVVMALESCSLGGWWCGGNH